MKGRMLRRVGMRCGRTARRWLSTCAATVVLAASVGALQQLFYFEPAPDWWKGLVPFTGWSERASFSALMLVLSGGAGWSLIRLHAGVPEFASFSRSAEAPAASVIVMPLPMSTTAVVPGDAGISINGESVSTLDDVSEALRSEGAGKGSTLQPAWEVLVAVRASRAKRRSPRPGSKLTVLLVASEESAADQMEALVGFLGDVDVERIELDGALDPHRCFEAVSQALAGRSRERIVFAPGGTQPMQHACAMLSIAKGQYLAYMPRNEPARYYDARVRRTAPIASMADY